MSTLTTPPDVVIVGGGIIGLSIAWRASQRGLSVTLLERDEVGGATSRVAAGMLAPVAEAEFGEAGRRLLDLGLRSAEMWPGFAAEIEDATGMPVKLLLVPTLMIARDEDEARELERQLAYRESLGLETERLRASIAREREPGLAPTVRLALEAPGDHSVEPRQALAALRLACERAGVCIRERAKVSSIVLDEAGERVKGVLVHSGQAASGQAASGEAPSSQAASSRAASNEAASSQAPSSQAASGEELRADRVVIAAGPWSPQIEGLPTSAQVRVRPVKGQILRLRDPAGPGLVTHVVRFTGGYLVPRGDGRYVLGASVEEKGFDLKPTAGVLYELLRDCSELVPGIDELRIEELSAGLRPGSPDNVPSIGPGAVAGLLWATGHHRNGILLAPLTAELVATQLAGEPVPPFADACSPDRFEAVPA
jgi:glycine oxidase